VVTRKCNRDDLHEIRDHPLLAEFGLVFAQGPEALSSMLADVLEDGANEMNALARRCFGMPQGRREDGSELTGNGSMGTPAPGGQPDPPSGIQRWPRIVGARRCRVSVPTGLGLLRSRCAYRNDAEILGNEVATLHLRLLDLVA